MVFDNFLRGLQLIKIGFQVLSRDKEIMLLPLASAAIILSIFLLTFLPMILSGMIFIPLMIVVLIIDIILVSFVGMFFQAAVVECARIRLTGGDPKARDGITKAWSRKKAIFVWALVNMTVGAIIRSLEERFGRILSGILEFAWKTATIFVLPVILYEKHGAWGSVKRSAELLKKGWGEAVSSGLGTGILFGLLSLIGVGLIVLGIFSGSFMALIILIIIAVVYFCILGIIHSSINGIIIAALYVTVSNKKSADKNIQAIEKILKKK